MSDEWVETTLGATCTFVKQRVTPSSQASSAPYVGLEHIDESTTRVTRTSRLSEVSSLVSSFHRGDTLFGRLRPYLRKVACADFAGFCSPEILVLRPHPASIESGYLHLVASSDSAIEHAVAVSAGSRMPRTSESDLAGFEFKLPPLAVQRRIVDLMTHLDNHLANLRAESDSVERVASTFRDSLLDSLAADGCQEVPLESLSAAKGEYGLGLPALDTPAGPKYLRTTDTISGVIDWERVLYCSASEKERLKATLLDGDIVIARTGANAGAASLVVNPPEGAVFAGYLVRFRLDAARTDPRFVAEVLRSSRWREYVGATKTGSAQPQFNAKLMGAFPLPLPPLGEQQAIGDTLQHLALNEAGLRREAEAVKKVRDALLAGLLEQAVSVDERYDALLGEVA